LQDEKRVSRPGESPTLGPIPNTTIRYATPNDAEAIASLLFESFVEYEQIVARMSEGPVWVAIHEEEIVGTVSVVAKAESLYIRGMAVLPSARGARIGALLLTHIAEFARREGFARLFLSTTPFLDRASRLYERFGFQRTSDEPRELFGTPLFTMEKPLNIE